MLGLVEALLFQEGTTEDDLCVPDLVQEVGAPGEQPVVTREGMIGTYWTVQGKWYFDLNGDRLWSECFVDLCMSNWRSNEKVWRGVR